MSTTKTEVARRDQSSTKARSDSIIDRALGLLSSVRFGIILLVLLLICCMVGMLIVQQNTESFREYYASLTPAQQTIYGVLGFFNIYHSWYFTLLLATTALNIILSSIDRFPTAWSYIRKPRKIASPAFTRAQMFSAVKEANGSREKIAERIVAAWRRRGMRAQVSREENRITVFAQRNVWNRLGAYAVHLALLLIFVGGFLTSRYSTGGSMEIMPGRSSIHFTTFASGLEGDQARRVALPFEVECVDLRQELIRPEGGLDVMNTVDWLSYIRIKDGSQEINALVHLNSPFDHRGYRFFQSSFLPEGNARQITIQLANGREAVIPRNTEVEMEGVGRVSYTNFYPDFTFEGGKAASASGEYANPVAELRIQAKDGTTRRAYAFNRRMLDEKPDGADEKIILKDFEKVATSHTLTVQYDPGRLPVYAGFALLTVALGAVFFFAHQRAWAVIESEGKGSRIYFGGNTNRNRPAFEGRFNTLINSATGREE